MKPHRLGPSIEVDAETIRYRRIFVAHLGVTALAREVSCTPQYISMLESGRQSRVSPAMFGRLKAALQAETDVLTAKSA
jgi:transcriptional regulator with XRE-family HTH domain